MVITVGFNDSYNMLSAAVGTDTTVFIAYFLWIADLTTFIKSYHTVIVRYDASVSQSLRQLIGANLGLGLE